MHEGKPQKQALAIAYAMKKRAKKAYGGEMQDPKDPVADSRLQSHAHECEMCGGKGCPSCNEESHNSDRHDREGEPMMAEGGQITDNYNSPSTRMHQTHDGDVDPQDNMTVMHQGNAVRDNESAEAEAERRLNQHGAHEEGRQGNEGHYAKGGYAGEEETTELSPGVGEDFSRATNFGDKTYTVEHKSGSKKYFHAPEGEHESVRKEAEAYYKRNLKPKKMAEGGQITDNYADTEDGDGLDMVGRIMAQRQQEYAEGGEAKYTPAYFEKQAKQTDEMHAKRGTSYGKEPGVHSPSYSSGKDKGQSIAGDLVRSSPYYKGEEKKAMAKDEHKRVLGEIKSQKTGYFSAGGQVANDTDRAKDLEDPRDDAGSGRYDDLVNRDDDMETADYTGANSGDETFTEGEEERRQRILSEVMASRRKKDRLPNPR